MSCTLDTDRAELVIGSGVLELTRNEFRLVQYLIANPGFVRSRDQIMDAVYGSGVFVEDRTVDSLVRRFRAKARALGADPIRTRSGFGYAWRAVAGAE